MVGTRITAGAVAVASLGTLLLTGTASAAASKDTEVYSDDGSHPGGMAWFRAYGEHFGVCDRKSDGLGVRGRLTWTDDSGSHERKVWHHGGHWDDRPDLSCTEYPKDFDIKEGTKVYLQVCLQTEKGAPLKYCDTDTGYA